MPWFRSKGGKLELYIDTDDALAAFGRHSPSRVTFNKLRESPKIVAQLAKMDEDTVRAELKGYRVWKDEEFLDHQENLKRLFWLACRAIVKETGP